MNRITGLFAVLIVLALSACGLPGSQKASSAGADRTIRMIIPGEPEALSALVQRQALKQVIDSNVLEPLLGLDKDGKPVPRLATGWEQLDPTTWRLKLRKGVKFHNGESFSARDVVETAKWLMDEQKTSTIYGYVPIKEATAVDDNTVDLKFTSPQPLFLIQQIYFVIYPASIASDPAKREAAVRMPVGTGPYQMVSWDAGRSIKLARYDGYWGTKPQIAGAEVSWRSEPAVRMAGLLANEADWVMDIPIEEVAKAPRTVPLTVPDRYEFRLDSAVQPNPILADKRLREALDYSIDRNALLQLFQGQAVVLQGQLALPGEFGYNADLKARPFDLEKAKDLVSEAGAVGRTMTMTCGTGKRPKQRELCEAAVSMFEKTGLKINLLLLAPGEDTNYSTNKPGKVSDIHQQAPDFLFESEGRFGSSFNKGAVQVAFDDQPVWDLFTQAKAETNLDARSEKLGKAWAALYQEAHYIPLVVPTIVYGLGPDLEWTPDITGWPELATMKISGQGPAAK